MRPPRKVARTFLVVGWYDEGLQRFADTYRAFTAQEAEAMAVMDNPELNVAGVVTGRNMKVVA